jgi:hypothetical protein
MKTYLVRKMFNPSNKVNRMLEYSIQKYSPKKESVKSTAILSEAPSNMMLAQQNITQPIHNMAKQNSLESTSNFTDHMTLPNGAVYKGNSLIKGI